MTHFLHIFVLRPRRRGILSTMEDTGWKAGGMASSTQRTQKDANKLIQKNPGIIASILCYVPPSIELLWPTNPPAFQPRTHGLPVFKSNWRLWFEWGCSGAIPLNAYVLCCFDLDVVWWCLKYLLSIGLSGAAHSVWCCSNDPGQKSISGSVVIIVLADGTLIRFESADASDIYRLITANMAELMDRSTWAVAKQEFNGRPMNKASRGLSFCCNSFLWAPTQRDFVRSGVHLFFNVQSIALLACLSILCLRHVLLIVIYLWVFGVPVIKELTCLSSTRE